MIDSLCLELNYRKHGVVSLSHNTENLFVSFENIKNPNYEFLKEFNDNFKKSIKILGDNNGFFDGEIVLYTSSDYSIKDRELLITRDYKDRENDTYTVYTYGVNSTDIKRVGKKALMQVFTDKVNMLISKYDN